jgi:hypothetical protein
MNLAEPLFQEITESINIVGQDPAAVADRRSPRLKADTHVAVFPWSSPIYAMSVRISNLSFGGVGLLHCKRMPLDEQFVVGLPRAAGQEVLILCKVIYWEPLAENLYAIGAQFQRVVEEPELAERHADVSRPTGVLARITHALVRGRKAAS